MITTKYKTNSTSTYVYMNLFNVSFSFGTLFSMPSKTQSRTGCNESMEDDEILESIESKQFSLKGNGNTSKQSGTTSSIGCKRARALEVTIQEDEDDTDQKIGSALKPIPPVRVATIPSNSSDMLNSLTHLQNRQFHINKQIEKFNEQIGEQIERYNHDLELFRSRYPFLF